MEITIDKTVRETIEVPKYFKKNGRFCKVLTSEYYISVNDVDLNQELDFTPCIKVEQISYYLNDGNFTSITETEFDLAFLSAERTLNKLRKI